MAIRHPAFVLPVLWTFLPELGFNAHLAAGVATLRFLVLTRVGLAGLLRLGFTTAALRRSRAILLLVVLL